MAGNSRTRRLALLIVLAVAAIGVAAVVWTQPTGPEAAVKAAYDKYSANDIRTEVSIHRRTGRG